MKFLLLTLSLSVSVLFGDIIKVPTDIRRIQDAVIASSNGDTIIVAPGQYFENLLIEKKAIFLTSEYILNEDPEYLANTYINGSYLGNVIQITDSPDTVKIQGMVVTMGLADRGSGINIKYSTLKLNGVTIKNNGDPDNKYITQSFGAGLYSETSSVIMDNCSISNNISPVSGGGLLFLSSAVIITNSIFSGNETTHDGGALWARATHVMLENCIFSMNSCEGDGSAINAHSGSDLIAKGCLFYNNASSPAIFCRGNKTSFINTTIAKNDSGALSSQSADIRIVNSIIGYNGPRNVTITNGTSLTIAFSALQNGQYGIDSTGINCFDWLTGNTSLYPQFSDSATRDFSLLPNSPCIDKGIQDTVIISGSCRDTIVVPRISFKGTAPDMGYFESPYITSVENNNSILPVAKNMAITNYPNPFNSETIIEFSLKESISIKLSLHDASGRQIKQLQEGFFPAGKHYLKFDLNTVSSGIYFVEISSKNERQIRKIVFIK